MYTTLNVNGLKLEFFPEELKITTPPIPFVKTYTFSFTEGKYSYSLKEPVQVTFKDGYVQKYKTLYHNYINVNYISVLLSSIQVLSGLSL